MAFTSGTRLGVYEIAAPIGEGGMGQVYRATDTALGRQVAVKILPEAFAADPERLSRFEREAKTLASLNHPHIAAIYTVEKSVPSTGSGQALSAGSGHPVYALVMELVDGEDLSQRILRRAIPVDEAIPIATQIAEALEAAHELGVIHRDLKPANIKVRDDGTVKVLDFGLAKALDPAGASSTLSMSPTLVSPAMTQAGMILGTAAYMSPEQAKGRTVDRRADVWAFGAVLFEMLSGRQAFSGENVSETLAEVMKSEPPWEALPDSTPTGVVRLIRQCLVKDPRQRIRDMGDVRLSLDGAFETSASQTTATTASPEARSTRPAAFGLATAAAAIAALVAGSGVWMLSRAAPASPAPTARLAIPLGDGESFGDLDDPALAVSPQGTLVAYAATSGGRQQLHVRAIDGVESRALAGTDLAWAPFFSPDGQWIGFFAQGKLKKISVAAGTIETLCDAPNGRGGSWSGNSIYFAAANNTGISRVSADGGPPTAVTTLDQSKGEISHRWPQVLPGGRALLFDVWTGPGNDEKQIQVLRLDGGTRTVVVQAGQSGRYVASGHVIYTRNDDLFAVPFDADGLRVSGQTGRLNAAVWRGGEGSQYAVSDNGVFVSVAGSPDRYERRLVWVGRDGRVEPLPIPPHAYHGNAVISPDGRRAAVDIEAGTIGVWLYDFMRGTMTPLSTGAGSSQAPRWTPDGARLVYRGTRMGLRNLWWKTVDDTAPEQRVTTGPSLSTPGSWSADGQWLVYYDINPTTGPEIWALPASGDRKPRVVVQTPFVGNSPRVSPDGRWLAYMTGESGRPEVMVQSFPDPTVRTQISANGGIEPVWSHDGRELFYVNRDAMMAVDIRTSPALSAGTPHKLFEGRFVLGVNGVASYDVSADGQRFLRVEPMHPDPPTNRIQVTLNWFEELKRLVPAK